MTRNFTSSHLQSLGLLLCLIFFFTGPCFAQSGGDPKPLIDALAKADFSETEVLLGKIAATGDTRVVPALEAFAAGDLYFRKADSVVFIGKAAGSRSTIRCGGLSGPRWAGSPF
jgi:urea transport system permease protein